jgi:hypothetical protein
LRPLKEQEEKPEEKPEEEEKGSSQVTPEGDDKKQEKKPGINIAQFRMDPRVASIAHNMYANKVNDIMTDRSIDAARKSVTLYDQKDTTKHLQGNLDAEMQG